MHKIVHCTRPGRDFTSRSRPPGQLGQVATSIHVATSLLSTSRPPGRLTYVATSTSCRDINPQQARLRRQFHVATSWSLSDVATSFPCRYIPHCRPCRDVKMMSRHQTISTSSLLRRDTMSRPPLLPPMSRPQNDVATSTTCCNSARSRRHFLVATSACGDLQTRSRPSAGNWQ